MANHASAQKRARQSVKISVRNAQVKSRIHTLEKAVRSAVGDQKKLEEALRRAFSAIQKAEGVIHRNAVKRKMARLSKVAASSPKANAAKS